MSTATSELETMQERADGYTVAAYVDTGGTSHSNCMLISYSAVGPIEIVPVPGAATYRGLIPVRAIIRELNP